MTSLQYRLLPYEAASGAWNMAADETMLEGAVRGAAALRFYGWSEPTVSLGYFQRECVRSQEVQLANLPYVRRPTGGLMLIHHFELTYAIALPALLARRTTTQSWLCRMHALLQTALAECGFCVAVAEWEVHPPSHTALCFQHMTPGDLLIEGRKVVGSAQRRQRGALLQHGAILLAASRHAPSLTGILELCGKRPHEGTIVKAVAEVWQREVSPDLIIDDWTSEERQRISALARRKYTQAAWNAKR